MRKTIVPERHFGYFSLYLLFFPRIAQSPIERPQKLLSQLREIHTFDCDLAEIRYQMEKLRVGEFVLLHTE